MKNVVTRAERIKKASSKRREEKKEEVRLLILDAAVELFEKHGYENFSLRQVAEAVGYTPTTIYLYFKNKDDLLFQTATEGFHTFGEKLKEAYDSSNEPYTRFISIGRAYMKFGLEHPVHYRLMFMQRGEFLSHKPPEGSKSVIDSFSVLQTAINDCIQVGLMADIDPSIHANMAWAIVHGIVALNISVPSINATSIKQLQDRFEHVVQEGLFEK